VKQEIWANDHEMHESLWQFLFTDNFGPSPSILSQFTLLQPKIAKKWLKFYGSRSFKAIDFDIPKELVASACYGKKHACAYLQPFST